MISNNTIAYRCKLLMVKKYEKVVQNKDNQEITWRVERLYCLIYFDVDLKI